MKTHLEVWDATAAYVGAFVDATSPPGRPPSSDIALQNLAAFADHANPEGKKVLVVVVDNAGWHTAGRLAVPANVWLHVRPPCTPELQPVEPFWALVREAVANDTFDRLAALKRRVARRCRRLAEDRETVLGAVGFYWAVRLEA
ncbi:MAG TPA: transposase [Urbifossiella sp.]|nr:transposase [Urbifossiella sp.]